MEKIESTAAYKALLKENKARFGEVVTNCLLLPNSLSPFIEEGRLYAELCPEGLLVLIDEERYYNVYYFLKPGSAFPEFSCGRMLLVEEVDQNGRMEDHLALAGPLLTNAGFTLYKNNVQVEMLLDRFPETAAEGRLPAEELLRLADPEGKFTGLGSDLRICYADAAQAAQAYALWDRFLNPTDVPSDHRILREDEPLLLFAAPDGTPAAVTWWKHSRKTSEVRHSVTSPDHLRRGLGSMLLRCWIEDARAHHIPRLITWISDVNYASLNMCSKVGFRRNGRTCLQYIKENTGEKE